MINYIPKNFVEFNEYYSTEEACRNYIGHLKITKGATCPRCFSRRYTLTAKGFNYCEVCKKQYTVTERTIFYRSNIPLNIWFRAIWHVTEQACGANATTLKEILPIGSYQTAFNLLHKLRTLMTHPKIKLEGTIVICQTYVSTVYTENDDYKGGQEKYLVAIAIKFACKKPIQVKASRIKRSGNESLLDFINQNVSINSKLYINDWKGLINKDMLEKRLINFGYHPVPCDEFLPNIEKIKFQLEYWFLLNFQCKLSRKYLNYYLNEFTFKYNCQGSDGPGKKFDRLLQKAVFPYHSV